MLSLPTSIPGVVRIQYLATPQTTRTTPSLLIETAHGATRRSHYTQLARKLKSPLPDNLIDFFHVNTDVGAPELGIATALALLEQDPTQLIALFTSEIPRTLIDVNRVLDIDPAAYREGKVTPGLPPYITSPEDISLLTGLHSQYHHALDQLVEATCRSGGLALMLHTYAPRSVDVQVDSDIVKQLHWAYQDEARWPLRPEIDVICRTVDGDLKIPEERLQDIQARYKALGILVADGKTYPLHPSTQAARHAQRWPGKCYCIEFRRDLLCSPWAPFEEQEIGMHKAELLAGPLAAFLAAHA